MGHGFSIADTTFIDSNEHIGAIFCMTSRVQLMVFYYAFSDISITTNSQFLHVKTASTTFYWIEIAWSGGLP
jgi:hypothetical protein